MDEWRARLRDVVARWDLPPEDEADIFEELEHHLEQQLVELRPRFGDAAALERIMQQIADPTLRSAVVLPRVQPAPSVRASRQNGRGFTGIVRDVRYGWRALLGSRGTSAMATTALALGIGLTTVMFTIIYGLLLRGLPLDEPDRIAMVMETNPSRGMEELPLSAHDFFAFRDAQRSFEAFGAWRPTTVNLSGDDRPERLQAARVTAAALTLARVQPLIGRSLGADDERPSGASVVILSHVLWRDRFASDSSIIGRTVRVNGTSTTVIGVMPEGFAYLRESKLWLPLRLDATTTWGTGERVNGVARLRPGVSYEQANADLGAIARRIEADHPASNTGVRAVVQPFIRATVPSRIYALMYAMFGAVSLVFLVACANVANLLLARAAHRSREVGIRIALGASRLSVARQFLVEALLVSLIAAMLGAGVVQVGLAAFKDAMVDELPFWADFDLDPKLFAFIASAAIVASLVSGLLPAITAARADITDVLKAHSLGSSSRRTGRLSRVLVVFELTLSAMLLVVAASTTKSILNLRSLEPGFRSRGILTGRISLTTRDTIAQAAFFGRLAAEIARLPGVTSTSLASNVLGSGWSLGSATIEGRTYDPRRGAPAVRHLSVTPGFFTTYDVKVVRGRPITDGDRKGSLAVAVVNQRFVDEQLRGADPIGRRINMTPEDSVAQWVTIVGLMPNLFAADPASLENPWPPEILTAFAQDMTSSATIAIRTNGDPSALAQPLRTAVASLDPDLPVYSLLPMTRILARARFDVRIFGGLFMVFGVVALALASIGLYAVLAFSVSRREREMGIRMALGAAASDVMRLVVRDGAMQLLIGIALGTVLGVGLAGAARTVLFGVAPSDPWIIAVVVVTLGVTGFVACIVPALRATRSDPVRSLRAE
jgi:putative ABC transport system permease protein